MSSKVSICVNCSSTNKDHTIYTCSKCNRRYCDIDKSKFWGNCPSCNSGVYKTFTVVGCIAAVICSALLFF